MNTNMQGFFAWKYDLFPGDPHQQAEYVFLSECDGDAIRAKAMQKRYGDIPLDRLNLLADDSQLAQAAIILVKSLRAEK